MGKKAKETIEEPSDTVKSLFGADNPFRRKSQPDPIAATAATTATATGTGSDLISHKAELGGDDIVEPRKRKRERGNPNPNPSPGSNLIPSKRKKLEDGDEGAKKRKKRKRDELEADYERSRYGKAEEDSKSDGEGEPDGVVVGEKRKAGKALSEIAVSKENFDNESKLLRTVFVGNLPLKTKKKTLLKEFASFGEIESVRIRSVPIVDTKTPRKSAIFKGKINDAIDSVHAYIVFKDEQSAQASLSHNMAEVGGNHIRVDMACPPRKKLKGEGPLYDRQRTVFVGNLPFDVKDEELYKLFCGPSQSESNVEAVRVIRDTHSSLGKGIAYVLFKTREAANSTARKRELKIRNRTLRLFHAKMTSGPEPKVNLPNKRTSSTGRSPSVKNDRPKGAATLSYQGLRSSKSGALKKTSLHPPSTGGSGNYGNNGSSKRKMGLDENGRKFKRPAVAARKAKLQNKRKQESGSSESGHRNKKFRKN